MRGRLFWKIVAVAWISWFAVAFFTGPELDGFVNQARQRSATRLRSTIEMQAEALSYALQAGGESGARELARKFPYYDRVTYTVRPVSSGPMMLDNSGRNIQVGRLVPTHNGDYYLILQTSRDRYFDLRRFYLATTDLQIMLMTAAVVTVTSLGLAFYIIRPIDWLRRGFKEASSGNLTTRLTPRAHGRKDEFADLARDFDAMTERLQALLGSRERLLQDVSHELRSPLTRLQMAIALARQNPDRTEASLERIELEVRRLDSMVDELLALSRAEIRAKRGRERFDLGLLLDSVVEDSRFEVQSSGKRLDFLPAPEWQGQGLMLSGDADLLRRGLENILRNALRVSEPGQAVDVRVEQDAASGLCVIQIEDRGPGAPDGALESIFEPFFRVNDGSTGQEGLGLGLSIARRAVELHHGRVMASNRPQGGLSVRIELPVEFQAAV